MRKIVDYKVAFGSVHEMVENINKAISLGYEPYGEMKIVETVCFQAVVKYEEEKAMPNIKLAGAGRFEIDQTHGIRFGHEISDDTNRLAADNKEEPVITVLVDESSGKVFGEVSTYVPLTKDLPDDNKES